MDTFNGTASPPDSLPVINLDFREVMNTFKIMFPTLDDDVIEAVLGCNKGDVDMAVDQLLTMSSECQTDSVQSGSMSCDDGGLPDAKPPQHTFFDPM